MRILLICFLSSILLAQEAPAKNPMDLLKPLVGKWSVVSSSKGPDGTWTKSEATESTVVAMLDGKLIQEQTTLKIGPMTFHMVVMYSYDPFRKVYRLAATDHMSGMMDIAEGVEKDGALVVDNLRAKTFFPWGDGKEGAFRLTKKFESADRLLIDAEVSFDQGATWAPYTKSEYTRKK